MTMITATTGAGPATAASPRPALTPAGVAPRVLAHRGLAGLRRPENSVAAVAAALALGADGVEVDVRLTADGVLVCSHDPHLTAADGRQVDIAGAPAAALLALDLGAGHHTATLADVLAVAGAHGRRVVVEAKAVDLPGYADRLGRELARVLGPAPERVTVSSFDGDLLAALAPVLRPRRVPTALLGRPGTALSSLLRRAVDAGHDEVHPALSAVLDAPAAVATARRLGVAVTPWTVNRRSDLRQVAALGVAALITDHPARAREALGRVPAAAGTRAG
ncbi:MAG: glycerophosphodiester phosphodiesterase [Oryzihumus sp.]